MKKYFDKSKIEYILKIYIAKFFSFLLRLLRFIMNEFKIMDYVPNEASSVEDIYKPIHSKRINNGFPNNTNFFDYSSPDISKRFNYVHGIEEIKIHKLISGQVFSELGMIKCNGKLFVDHIYHTDRILEKETLRKIYNHRTPLFLPKKKIYLESAILISARWPGNYYHWMMDVLTKFEHIQNIGQIKNIILVSPNNNKFLSLSNRFTNYRNVYLTNNNTQFVVKDLYVINFPIVSGLLSGKKIPFLRENFNTKNNCQSNDKYVYISRRNSNERRVENEVELMKYLSNYGFKEYQLELMEINKQIELFANAKIIVSPHGAGLTNIIFCCKHRTSLIELFNSNYVNNCYTDISRYLNIHYNAYIDSDSNSKNIRVDLNVFKKQFQEIFEK